MELLIPLILVAVGLTLIVIEVGFALGINVVGIGGFVMMVFGVGYAFTVSGLAGGMITLGVAVVASAATAYGLWATGAWQRFVRAASDEEEEPGGDARSRYLGRTGVALTPLRPGGVAEVDGERIEVVTEGDFIAAGSRIRVVAMDRRRLFVKLAGKTATLS